MKITNIPSLCCEYKDDLILKNKYDLMAELIFNQIKG